MQAALRGDGGANTNSAADARTLKALLLNGAVKPADWTNSTSAPLDTLYGAGVLNVFNSYEQLASGQHSYIVSTSASSGSPRPPTGATGTVSALSGWDFNSISSTAGNFIIPATDGVNHCGRFIPPVLGLKLPPASARPLGAPTICPRPCWPMARTPCKSR